MDVKHYVTNRVSEIESNAISANQSLAEAQSEIDKLKNGIAKIEDELAKIGYQINGIEDGVYEVVKTEYGADNPIIWEEGMTLVDNQFYLKPDGKVYVWMGDWVEW